MASRVERDYARKAAQIEKRLDRIERKLSEMLNVLSDASQKLCYIIKRQRDYLGARGFDSVSD